MSSKKRRTQPQASTARQAQAAAPSSVGRENGPLSAQAQIGDETTMLDAARVEVADVDVAGVQAGWSEGLHASVDEVAVKKVGAEDVSVAHTNAERGRQTTASASSLGIHEVGVHDASLTADKTGLSVAAEGVDYTSVAASDVALSHDNQSTGRSARAGADELAFHEVAVGPSTVDVDKTGMHVASDSVDFVNTRADNLSASYDNRQTGRHAELGIDQLDVHDVAVRDATFDATREGISVHADSVEYANTTARGAHAAIGNEQTGNGASASADLVDVHRFRGEGLDFQSNGLETDVSAQEVYWRNTLIENGQAQAQVGDYGAAASVDQATINEVEVGSGALHMGKGVLTAEAQLNDARYTSVDARGASASLSHDGQTVLGASGDVHSSYAAEQVNAGYDLTQGSASASVEGFRHERSMGNARINLMGTEIELPDVAVLIAADASAGLDLSEGAVDASINLAGSELTVGDETFTVPDWAKASVDASIADKQLNLNVGGVEIDVDEAVGALFRRVASLFSDEEPSSAQIEQGRGLIDEAANNMAAVQDEVRGALRG